MRRLKLLSTHLRTSVEVSTLEQQAVLRGIWRGDRRSVSLKRHGSNSPDSIPVWHPNTLPVRSSGS